MAYEIIIPESAQVPAYALLDGSGAAEAANAAAMFGGSAGAPPRIKAAGKAFVLINEAGEQTPYPPGNLTKGPDGNLYLQVIVLGVKPALTKTFYLNPYNPNDEEHGAPDCQSLDGVKPIDGCFAPQSDICATCPQNVFGSGRDQNGNPTKGKGCTDNGMVAVVVPGYGVYQLKLMPKSLKPWRQYVTELTKRNYRLDSVITLVGFDLASEYAIYQFQFGGFVPEKTLPKLVELAASSEVDAIINPMGMVSAAPKALAAPAPVDPPKDTTAEDAAKAKAEEAAKKKAEAAAKKKAEAAAKAAAAAQPPKTGIGQDQLSTDLGLDGLVPTSVEDTSDDALAELLKL